MTSLHVSSIRVQVGTHEGFAVVDQQGKTFAVARTEDGARQIAAGAKMLDTLWRIAASDANHSHFATLVLASARDAIEEATGERPPVLKGTRPAVPVTPQDAADLIATLSILRRALERGSMFDPANAIALIDKALAKVNAS